MNKLPKTFYLYKTHNLNILLFFEIESIMEPTSKMCFKSPKKHCGSLIPQKETTGLKSYKTW